MSMNMNMTLAIKRIIYGALAFGFIFWGSKSATVGVAKQSAFEKQVSPDVDYKSHMSGVRYQNGYFTAVRRRIPRDPNGQEVVVLDGNGHSIFSRFPGKEIGDATGFSLHDAALGKNGILAAIGTAVSRTEQMASVLFIYDFPSRKLQNIVRLSPVTPARVAVDEQNNIWVLGLDLEKAKENQDSSLLYKLSGDGNFVGKHLQRSLLNDTSYKKMLFTGMKFGFPELYADQQGRLYLCLADHLTFLTMNLDGKIIAQTRMPEFTPNRAHTVPFTVQPNGTLLGFLNGGIHRLDEKTGNWEKLGDPNFQWASFQLVGCDDGSIIMREKETGKFLWIPLRPRKMKA